MKIHRHQKLGFVLFCLYLVLLTYFLFFAEQFGRDPNLRAQYSYNLIPFKEIRRFLVYRDLLGYQAVCLNIVGNVIAFLPFGFFLPMIWKRTGRWYTTTLISLAASVCVETVQLASRVGSFDVDDMILNTAGGFLGYLTYRLLRGVWKKYSGTNRK